MFRYVGTFVILTLLGVLYEKYKVKFVPDEELEKYDLIKKYLLNGNEYLGGKPILWVHSKHNINARNWTNFGSRNTNKLNQPYILSCIETIVKHCGESFHVCLIDDKSFTRLLPKWDIDISNLAEPVRNHIRKLAMAKLLYTYGGMQIPDSTIVLKDLIGLHNDALLNKDCFIGEKISRNVMSTHASLTPNLQLIGCKRNSKSMNEYIKYLELLNSRDYTNEVEFEGKMERFINKLCMNGMIKKIDGKIFGAKDKQNKDVNVDRLMGKTYIDFASHLLHGIYIDGDMLLKRPKYAWFCRLSQQQLLNCDNIICKWILIGQN